MTAASKIYDGDLLLKDAGLVATSAAATVGGEAKILDTAIGAVGLGGGSPAADGYGEVVIDISAIEIADNDENYVIVLQGSNASDFSAGVEELAAVRVGAKETLSGDIDTAVGRIPLPYSTERAGTKYRYLRIFTVVAGTVATGINYTAFLSKRS